MAAAIGPSPPPVNTQPALELRSLQLYLSLVQECIGTLIYLFLICSVSIPWTGHYPPFLSIAFVAGIGYTVLTWRLFRGAHLNPVFTLAEWLLGRITGLRFGLYAIGQCGGAVAGAAIVYGLTTPGYQGTLGSTTLATNIEPLQAVFIELILSYLLVLVYLTSDGNSVAVGAVLLAGNLVATPSSGGSLNPSRSLGPAFVMNRWGRHWVHWIGPLAGALAAAYFYKYVLLKRRMEAAKDGDVESNQQEEDGSECAVQVGQLDHVRQQQHADRVLQHTTEPLYNGTRSLYMRPSPVLPTRVGLNRSQSVYASKRLLEAIATPAVGRRRPPPNGEENYSSRNQPSLLTTATPNPTAAPPPPPATSSANYGKGLLLPAAPSRASPQTILDSAYFKPTGHLNSCGSSTLDRHSVSNNQHSAGQHCNHHHSRQHSHDHHSLREKSGGEGYADFSRLTAANSEQQRHSHNGKEYRNKIDKFYEPLPPTPPPVDRSAINLKESHPLEKCLQPPPRYSRPPMKAPQQQKSPSDKYGDMNGNGNGLLMPRRPYEYLPQPGHGPPEKDHHCNSSRVHPLSGDTSTAFTSLKFGYSQLPTSSPLTMQQQHPGHDQSTYSYH